MLKQFGPQRKNLSFIFRGYKSALVTQSLVIKPGFKWNSRFYDSILRDDTAFQSVQLYIADNPKNWKQ